MMNCRWTKKNLPYNIVRMYFYMLKKKEENTSFRAVIYWLSYFPPQEKSFYYYYCFFIFCNGFLYCRLSRGSTRAFYYKFVERGDRFALLSLCALPCVIRLHAAQALSYAPSSLFDFSRKWKKWKRFFHIFKSKAFCGGREVSLVEQRIRHNCWLSKWFII